MAVDDPIHAPSAAAQACAWAGAVAFVVSLSFFLFSYDITYGVAATGASRLVPIVWNIILFSVFALHHSLFARSGLREWIGRTFRSLERSVYVWVSSVLLILVCAWWNPIPGVMWQVSSQPVVVLLRILHVAGIVLSIASAAAIDIWVLSGVSQIYPASKSTRPDSFKSTGLYGLVRHPIYTGWFLTVFAMPTMTMTQFVFAVVSAAYVLLAIPFEERSLLATTAGAYERYRQKVRFRIVPGIY